MRHTHTDTHTHTHTHTHTCAIRPQYSVGQNRNIGAVLIPSTEAPNVASHSATQQRLATAACASPALPYLPR